MTRKIIQILHVPNRNPETDRVYGVIYALCDDGTLWWKNEQETANWQLEADLPQNAV